MATVKLDADLFRRMFDGFMESQFDLIQSGTQNPSEDDWHDALRAAAIQGVDISNTAFAKFAQRMGWGPKVGEPIPGAEMDTDDMLDVERGEHELLEPIGGHGTQIRTKAPPRLE